MKTLVVVRLRPAVFAHGDIGCKADFSPGVPRQIARKLRCLRRTAGGSLVFEPIIAWRGVDATFVFFGSLGIWGVPPSNVGG